MSCGFNGDINITQLSGAKGAQLISKVRVAYMTTDPRTAYFDFYVYNTGHGIYENTYKIELYSGDGVLQTPVEVSETDSTLTNFVFNTNSGFINSKSVKAPDIVGSNLITAPSDKYDTSCGLDMKNSDI